MIGHRDGQRHIHTTCTFDLIPERPFRVDTGNPLIEEPDIRRSINEIEVLERATCQLRALELQALKPR